MRKQSGGVFHACGRSCTAFDGVIIAVRKIGRLLGLSPSTIPVGGRLSEGVRIVECFDHLSISATQFRMKVKGAALGASTLVLMRNL